MTTTTPTPQPPFKTKKAIRDAMTVGSRWAIGEPDGSHELEGVIVRRSSTSRWFIWDGVDLDRPMWLPVGDTRDWAVHADGYVEMTSQTKLRFLAPAPEDLDHARIARLALPRNRKAGPCANCGSEVPVGAGHVRAGATGWEAIHAWDGCLPAAAV